MAHALVQTAKSISDHGSFLFNRIPRYNGNSFDINYIDALKCVIFGAEGLDEKLI